MLQSENHTLVFLVIAGLCSIIILVGLGLIAGYPTKQCLNAVESLATKEEDRLKVFEICLEGLKRGSQ